jgi:hypothetical protein
MTDSGCTRLPGGLSGSGPCAPGYQRNVRMRMAWRSRAALARRGCTRSRSSRASVSSRRNWARLRRRSASDSGGPGAGWAGARWGSCRGGGVRGVSRGAGPLVVLSRRTGDRPVARCAGAAPGGSRGVSPPRASRGVSPPVAFRDSGPPGDSRGVGRPVGPRRGWSSEFACRIGHHPSPSLTLSL